ncbi:MAG: metallophosphoesterase [Methanosarcinales archaeon]|nr:metallophosphoesterase [Methanosarcinales archaeon]
MLIGMISDSHDNLPDLKKAAGIFQERNVKLVLHAGDVIAPGMCYAFQNSGIDIKLVYGNNDGDRVGIKRDFESVGGEVLGDFGEVEADGLTIALLHGTDEGPVRALVRSGLYDVVVRGHNHHYLVEKGPTLMINPGEIWGHFTGHKTLAILDTSSLEVEIVHLGEVPSLKDRLGWTDR